MGESLRELKRRTKSIVNIRQITHAMQLVATAKMRRCQKRSNDADVYAYGALEILSNITVALRGLPPHSIFQKNDTGTKVRFLILGTDRGFCGGLNTTLFQRVAACIQKEKEQGYIIDAVTIGKKAARFVRRVGVHLVADFPLANSAVTMQDIFPVAHVMVNDFKKKEYKKMYLCFNQFIHTLLQRPFIRQILPITKEIFEEIVEFDPKVGRFFMMRSDDGKRDDAQADYIFEPHVSEVFEKLIPHLLYAGIYKAVLEAQASEYSSRMVTMKNATEKAEELIGDLRLAYNQERQAAITKEIAEISSGALALV